MASPGELDALRAEMEQLRREIAQLRAAEASYRTIVDRTNSIVLRWDPEGRVLFLNDFGLTPVRLHPATRSSAARCSGSSCRTPRRRDATWSR